MHTHSNTTDQTIIHFPTHCHLPTLVVFILPADDVLFYPAQFNASGYSPELLKGDIQLPPTVNESLITKVR